MPPLSRDAILAVLSGLTALGCDKSASPQPEPLPPAVSSSAAKAAGAVAPAPAAVVAAPSGSVGATEVKPAAGDKAGEKEMACSPGGCAPGQCGAKK